MREYWHAIAPHSEAGSYVNFVADDEQDRIQDSYRGNFRRLVEVKRTYDPGNLFRLNQTSGHSPR